MVCESQFYVLNDKLVHVYNCTIFLGLQSTSLAKDTKHTFTSTGKFVNLPMLPFESKIMESPAFTHDHIGFAANPQTGEGTGELHDGQKLSQATGRWKEDSTMVESSCVRSNGFGSRNEFRARVHTCPSPRNLAYEEPGNRKNIVDLSNNVQRKDATSPLHLDAQVCEIRTHPQVIT